MRLAASIFALVVCACTAVDSTGVPTSKMSADITVDVTDSTSTVGVVLRASSDAIIDTNIIELSSDDVLTASVDGRAETLQPSSILGYTSYAADFDGGGARTFAIELERTSGVSALDSSVVTPPDFQLTTQTLVMSRVGDEVLLAWSPASMLPIEVVVSGECIDEYQSGDLADVGRLDIPAATLQPSPHQAAPASCTVTAQVVRRVQGTLDPGFGLGGSVTGRQVRAVTFTSDP